MTSLKLKLVAALFLFPTLVLAQQAGTVVKKRIHTADKITQASVPEIDGSLSESIWSQASWSGLIYPTYSSGKHSTISTDPV